MKSRIIIEFESEFTTKINSEEDMGGEDITEEAEKSLHEAVFRVLENQIIDNDTFEETVLEHWEDCPDISEFNELGKIRLSVRRGADQK